MFSDFEEDTCQTVDVAPSFKRHWGLLIGLLLIVLVAYSLWKPSTANQPTDESVESSSGCSQPALSSNSQQAKAMPGVGMTMPQDWWQSPAAQAEANKQVIARLYAEVLNAGASEWPDDLFAADFVYREADISADMATHRQQPQAQYAAYHDLRFTIEDMVSEGDQVVVRWLASGTPLQTFETHPPTGQPEVWRGVTIWQVKEGKIVAGWTVFAN